MFANPHVMLARNLQRQADEFPTLSEQDRIQLRSESAQQAVMGLLQCAPAPDCCIHAIEVLQDVDYNATELNNTILPAAIARFPELTAKIQATMNRVGFGGSTGSGAVSANVRSLWNEGKRWMQTPDPKNLAEGIRIFGGIVQASSMDYWAHIIYASCLLGTTAQGSINAFNARQCREMAVNIAAQARAIDPLYPHGDSGGAQALGQLGRVDEAVNLVGAMLDRSDLKVTFTVTD
jgi:hypothetical protein